MLNVRLTLLSDDSCLTHRVQKLFWGGAAAMAVVTGGAPDEADLGIVG